MQREKRWDVVDHVKKTSTIRIDEAICQEAVPPRAIDNHIITNRSAGKERCVQIGGVSIKHHAALLQLLHYQKMAQRDICNSYVYSLTW